MLATGVDGAAGVKPDFVVDCIDNIDTKIDLLEYCLRNGIRAISSGGAGGRSDPTALQIADIAETKGPDPLLRDVRQKLRARFSPQPCTGLPMVFSTEKAKPLLPLESHQEQDPEQFRVFGGKYRIRTMPVLGPIPAIFGQAMAAYVICELAGEPLAAPVGRERVARKEVMKMFGEAVNREITRYNSKPGVDGAPHFDLEDAEYMVNEVWHGKSAISTSDRNRCIRRWNSSQPLSPSNCVLLTKSEGEKHEGLGWFEVSQKDCYNSVMEALAKAGKERASADAAGASQ